jgi:two-component system, OmpR family, response regulator
VSEQSRSALVVDDDPDIRKIVSTYLQRLGFKVREAADGRAALVALSNARPTLLCIDVMLPETSGYDVCEHVRGSATLRGLPILVMSARDMPKDKAIAEELGARAYLTKPFTQAAFVAHVELALATEGAEP